MEQKDRMDKMCYSPSKIFDLNQGGSRNIAVIPVVLPSETKRPEIIYQ